MTFGVSPSFVAAKYWRIVRFVTLSWSAARACFGSLSVFFSAFFGASDFGASAFASAVGSFASAFSSGAADSGTSGTSSMSIFTFCVTMNMFRLSSVGGYSS